MIFYFSGTGNSLYVARRIAEGTGDKAIAMSECLDAEQCSFELADDERLGFVFPTYFFGAPSLVLDFIDKLELKNYSSNYTFAASTSGSYTGNLHSMLQRKLNEQNIHLDASFNVAMPDNYIILLNLLTPTKKVAKMLASSVSKTDAIIAKILAGKTQKPQRGILRLLVTKISYPIYNFTRKTHPFHSTAECNGCGLCSRVCPCQMIEMQNKKPSWKEGRCAQCLACLHRCPQHAIEYGKKTQKRGRYINPNVKMER